MSTERSDPRELYADLAGLLVSIESDHDDKADQYGASTIKRAMRYIYESETSQGSLPDEIERKIVQDVYETYHEWGARIQTEVDDAAKVRVQDTSDYPSGAPMHIELEGHGLFEISVTVKRLPGGNRWRECATCNAGGHTCPGDGESIEHGQTDCGQHGGPSAFVQLAASDPSFGFTERERQRLLDEELNKVEISTEPGANPVGKLIEVNERVKERMERDHGQPLWLTFSYPCFDCENGTHICADCCASLKHGQKACGKPPVITNVPLERIVESDEPKEIFPTLMERDVPVSQLLTGDSVFSESAGTWHDVRVDGRALYLKRGESWVAMSHLPRDTKFRTRRGAPGRAADALFMNFGGEVIRDARD